MKESKELIEVLDYFIGGTKNVIAGCDENDPSLPEEYKRLKKLLRGKKWVLSIVVGQSEQLKPFDKLPNETDDYKRTEDAIFWKNK